SDDQAILASLGYTGWDGKFKDTAASASSLGGSQTLDFGVALSGISIIAIHYGGGTNSPGRESTAFYVLDAAQGISQIHLAYGASSNAVLFVTGLPHDVIGTVPEPATWATMVGGFGLVGGQMRRRRRTSATA
ncbi:MAG: PEPxxWA-CTERM sorting domain-containing protein, partial [Asticcacaulis sp.]|nr:PEPxxWA-CTERM sorting domain-containing protein [Asticcacaulis sp.]